MRQNADYGSSAKEKRKMIAQSNSKYWNKSMSGEISRIYLRISYVARARQHATKNKNYQTGPPGYDL